MTLFAAVSIISNLVMFGGVIFSVGIPTLIAVIYSKKNYTTVTDY